jgi:hypothetical protein
MDQGYQSYSLYNWNRLIINVIQHLERSGCDVREHRRKFYELKKAVLQCHRELNRALGGSFNRVRLKGLEDDAFKGLTFPRDMIQQELDFLRDLHGCLENRGFENLALKISEIMDREVAFKEKYEG